MNESSQPRVVELAEAIQTISHNRKHKVRFEHRDRRYMFGTRNYGDVPTLINEADGDPWDVFKEQMKLPMFDNYVLYKKITLIKLFEH